MEACRHCTLSQVAVWNHTLKSTVIKNEFVVALQGEVAEISIKCHCNTSSSVDIQYVSDDQPQKLWSSKYNEPEIISSDNAMLDLFFSSLASMKKQDQSEIEGKSDVEEMEGERIHKCKTQAGYNQHTITILTKTTTYIFIKFMDQTISSTTEYADYFDLRLVQNYIVHFYNDTYPSCPNLTHHPKLFSWKEASQLCKEYMNGSLPQFVSRDDQEEFLSVVRDDRNVFPLESAFIGLKKFSPGRVSKPTTKTLIESKCI